MSNLLSFPAAIWGTLMVAVYTFVLLSGLSAATDSKGLELWYSLGAVAVVVLAGLFLADLKSVGRP